MNHRLCMRVAVLLLSSSAWATTNQTSAAAVAKTTVVHKDGLGSNVVVGQDSAMGLTLMPWKEEFATGLDQPPTLYRAPLSPVDGDSLQRQTQYRDDLNNYRRSHSQYTQ